MAGAHGERAKAIGISSLRPSILLTIAGTAIGGALAACLAAAVISPGVPVGAQLVEFLFVAAAAAMVGVITSIGSAPNSSDEDVRLLSKAVKSLLRDPNLVQRVPVCGDEAVSELAGELNILIDSFETRQRALQESIAQVRAMRDESESASLAKSHFLANMSHELRTPLNAIIGYAMLLQEDAQSAGETEAASDLDRILRAARHLLMLINDILDLSKIEAGKDEVDYSPVHLRTLIDETLAAVGPSAHENSAVKFDLTLPEQDLYMQTDTMKVRQCLVNLLSNAFKFTEAGSVSLNVTCRDAGAVPVVEFEVKDTGIGIEADKLDILFDAFVQADASTTQKYGGTGLGLAISRRLAGLLGGDLYVESVPGEGSTFTLIIPREPRRQKIVQNFDELTTEVPANDQGDGEQLALVIDDDASTVDLLSRWLKRQGYCVVTAFDGEQGIEAARAHNPDLILLDIHMPGINGWDVLSELNEDEMLHDVPVVVISVDDNRKRGLDSGAAEYLTKPTSQEHLSSILKTYNTTTAGHILVVDDDEDAGNIIERAARQVGLEVSRAFDGVTGLEMAREHKPSAIVLDLTMPRKDGFSVLAELGLDPDLRMVPVIIVSARTLTGNEFHQIAESGCDFHAKGVSSPHDIAANLISVVNE